MTSPYINTELYTTVSLFPNQMNNSFYLHLKKNLENAILHKCLKNFGYIMDIYEITRYDNGKIEAENLAAYATFNVAFSCKLCKPLKSKNIICQVEKIRKLLFTAVNGPIIVIITNDRINESAFFLDNSNNIRYKKDGKSELLKPNDFVIITIGETLFAHGEQNIKAMGYLHSMATEEESKMFYEQLYDKSEIPIKLEDYTKNV